MQPSHKRIKKKNALPKSKNDEKAVVKVDETEILSDSKATSKSSVIIMILFIISLLLNGYQFIYYSKSQGYEIGYQEGFEKAFSENFDVGYSEGYEEGNFTGYSEGLVFGRIEGMENVYNLNLDAGYNEGFSEGYAYGNVTGYLEGYEWGLTASIESRFNIRDPTYQEVIDFIGHDTTDELEYISHDEPGYFVCGDFASTVKRNAFELGFRAFYVVVDFQDGARARACLV